MLKHKQILLIVLTCAVLSQSAWAQGDLAERGQSATAVAVNYHNLDGDGGGSAAFGFSPGGLFSMGLSVGRFNAKVYDVTTVSPYLEFYLAKGNEGESPITVALQTSYEHASYSPSSESLTTDAYRIGLALIRESGPSGHSGIRTWLRGAWCRILENKGDAHFIYGLGVSIIPTGNSRQFLLINAGVEKNTLDDSPISISAGLALCFLGK